MERSRLQKLLIFAALPAAILGRDNAIQSFPLADAKGLMERNVKLEPVEYRGRKAIRMNVTASEAGWAVLPDTDFQDGTIEADVALKTNVPPGVRMPGFIGIAFRMRDSTHYDLFYIRPGNSVTDDQAMRNHSVQYCSEPDFGWYFLRRTWPGVYESWADLEPEAWTHIKIDAAGRAAKLYLNDSVKPSLTVDGLKGEDLHGGVALWGYANEDSYFSNVRITNREAEPVQNGADATGAWDVRLATDAGTFGGSLKITRDGNRLAGTWSGALGEYQPVTGTWRNGYLELSFNGHWPKDYPMGQPGEAGVRLAGWIEGSSAKGRVTIEGHADGQWSANRRH